MSSALALVPDEVTVAGRREPPLRPLVVERPDHIDLQAFRAWESASLRENTAKGDQQMTIKKGTFTRISSKRKTFDDKLGRAHDQAVLDAFARVLQTIAAHPSLGAPTIRDEIPLVLLRMYGYVHSFGGETNYPTRPDHERLHLMVADALEDIAAMEMVA